MIVVRLELWPHGERGPAREIGRMYIGNDGTSRDPKRGSYDVKVCRKGRFAWTGWDRVVAARTGRVEDYPRTSYNVWRLITRALLSAFPEES